MQNRLKGKSSQHFTVSPVDKRKTNMKTLLSCLILLFSFIPNDDEVKSKMNRADRNFEKRFKSIENGKASSKFIDRAIKLYGKAPDSEEKYIGLLRSYEFKGSWTNISDEEATDIYKKAVELGRSIKDLYPNSAGVWYWYIANLSRWGDQVSITEAAKEGVLDEIKTVTEKIIGLDPSYQEAGALRLLGGIHLKAPNIPFVLTWPSDDEAKKLLSRAYEIAPQNAANTYYYSLMLINEEQHAKAKSTLEEFIKREAREDFLLADRKFIAKGKELYEEEF